VKPTGFREYDARWLFPQEINLMGVQALGMGLGTLAHEMGVRPDIVTGHDFRAYSSSIKYALVSGLMAAGMRVKDVGLALSPMAYFGQFALDCPCVAMVTASHNDNGWTGVKMGANRPLTFGPDEMGRLRDIVLAAAFRLREGGAYAFIEGFGERYIADLTDRPKIKRAPENMIRFKAIDPPLITETEFARAQELMRVKRERHWSNQPGYVHRFQYGGFLTCSLCGKFVQTGHLRDDYYVCKGRRLPGEKCVSKYMRRDRLDSQLDSMFARDFTDREFLIQIVEKWSHKENRQDDTGRQRLEAQYGTLQGKRQRILDAFFEGVIDRPERDRRLTQIDSSLATVADLLMQEQPAPVEPDTLKKILRVFVGWERLKPDQKRRILPTVVPEIKVANYRVEGVWLAGWCNQGSPTAAVSLIAPRLWIPLGIELA